MTQPSDKSSDVLLFAKSKSDHLTGLAFALVFAMAAFAIAVVAPNIVLRYVGATVALGFAIIFVRNSIAGVPESSATVLNSDGIVTKWGLIPWSEVSRYWIAPAGAALMLCIELRHPEQFKPVTSDNVVLSRFNRAMNLGHLQLPVAWSHRSRQEVEQFVRKFAKFEA